MQIMIKELKELEKAKLSELDLNTDIRNTVVKYIKEVNKNYRANIVDNYVEVGLNCKLFFNIEDIDKNLNKNESKRTYIIDINLDNNRPFTIKNLFKLKNKGH